MGVLDAVLNWVDNKRRVAGRNVSDLATNPSDYLSMTAANIPQTVKEYGEDPMNFIGGGVGAGTLKLIKGGKPKSMTPMDEFGLLNYEPPASGAMSAPSLQESGVGMAMKKLNAPKGADFSDIPDSRGLYPVTVDGIPVFYEDTLLEARNAAKIIDVDFWRGEMENFTPAQRMPLSEQTNAIADAIKKTVLGNKP